MIPPMAAQPPARPHLQAAAPRRHRLHESAEVRPYGALGPGLPVVGAVGVVLKKATRRVLRWYLWPVAGRLSAHNLAVADVVAEHRRQLTRVALEVERADRNATLLAGEDAPTAL